MKDPAGLSVCGDGAAPLADESLTFLQEIKCLLVLQPEWHSLWILRLTVGSHTACVLQYIDEAKPMLSP